MMYTKSTFRKNEWSSKYNNFKIDLSKTETEAIAVIAAISREKGCELVMLFRWCSNKMKFKGFAMS